LTGQTTQKSVRVLIYFAQAAVLIAAMAVIYAPSLNSQFQLDDGRIIVSNNYLRLPDLRPQSLWRAAVQDGGNNRPLPNLTMALNYYFNGYRPFGYHLVNLFILAATAFGVWLALNKLLGQLGYASARRPLAAWLAAFLWSVHPVNIMAITYVSQRYVCMAGAFSVWSIYFFHLGNESGKRKWPYLALSGLLCALALLSKETALPLPLILLCYKLYFFDGLGRGWLKRNWKWGLALLIFYAVCAVILLRPGMSSRLATDVAKLPYSVWQRSLSEPRALLWYLSLILFPFPNSISLFHDFQVSSSIFHPPFTAISMVAVAAAVFLAVLKAREWKVFSFAVVWYLGQLIVEALPLPIDLVNEYRLYLGSLSIIAPAAAGLVLKSKNLRPALGCLLLIAVIFAAFSRQRNQDWQTELTLLKDSSKKAPGSTLVWSLYCKALGKAGKFDLAVGACKIAIKSSPENYQAHLTLGVIYMQAGQMELAEEELKKAIKIYPNVYGAHNYLGFCYLQTGEMRLAETELRKAVELSRQSAVQPMFNLGLFYSLNGDHENAAKWFQAVIARDPYHAQAHYLFAQTNLILKKDSEYLAELRRVIELDPQGVQPRVELARALAERKQCPDALELIQNVPAREPELSEIRRLCQDQ